MLLEFGADPNVFDRKGLTPIMKACRMRDKGIEAIKILLKYGADINKLSPERQDHRSALHFALLSGNHELVKFLIANGCNVNMDEKYEKPSPIDIAVLKDDPELLKILLDAGANPNAVHTYIGSCLHLASCSSKRKSLRQCEILNFQVSWINTKSLNFFWSTAQTWTFSTPSQTVLGSRVHLLSTSALMTPSTLELWNCSWLMARKLLWETPFTTAVDNSAMFWSWLLSKTNQKFSSFYWVLGSNTTTKLLRDFHCRRNWRLISVREPSEFEVLEINWKWSFYRNPHSLQHLCRIQIRDTVQTSEYKTLPIPEFLKAYLLGLIPWSSLFLMMYIYIYNFWLVPVHCVAK